MRKRSIDNIVNRWKLRLNKNFRLLDVNNEGNHILDNTLIITSGNIEIYTPWYLGYKDLNDREKQKDKIIFSCEKDNDLSESTALLIKYSEIKDGKIELVNCPTYDRYCLSGLYYKINNQQLSQRDIEGFE